MRSSEIRLEPVPKKALNRRIWYGFLFVKFLLLVFGASATGLAADAAASKHRVLENRWSQGPWHGVSQMVLFDDRLWFINSNPYKDTNAADLYSLALNTGEVRYEQSLFSQDIGNPLVYEGRLYLPFEDPRRSAGRGEYVRTDGSRYEWRSFVDGRAFHVHAMGNCHGRLLAVTGAFTGQIQAYDEQWRLLDDYPKGEAGFSRLVSIMQFGNECLFGAMARRDSRPKLLRLDGSDLVPVEGWPSGDRAETAVVFDKQALAINDLGETRSLIAWDGKNTKTLTTPSGRVRALSVDQNQIYLITSDKSGGGLWSADSSFNWQLLQRFDTTPISLLVSQGNIFVGTWSTQGGALFSNQGSNALDTPSALPLPVKNPPVIDKDDLDQRVGDWWQTLSKTPDSNSDLSQLRDLIKTLEFNEHPLVLQQLAAKIDSLPDTGVQKMFGSRELDRSTVIRWYIKTTAAIRDVAEPAVEQVTPAFTKAENPAAKYLDDTIAAIVGAGRDSAKAEQLRGSADKQIAAHLIARLQRQSDPLWVQSDIVGALTRLTNQSYAYDRESWARWLAMQK